MILPDAQSAARQWRPKLFLAYMGEPAFRKALEILRKLRREGHACYLDYSQGSLKSQMRLANKLKAEHALILGDDELRRERYALKKLDDSRQWEVTLSELSDYLRS
jgi:histidyl-tRNA synthetase